ncbi:S-methylmethionine-dependent homocysteine/selenocysteine methylase [Aeromicrobium panaciterrae]|uniref:S-methylmethionine-dependent homocysteine/selenocysteine methylase n=1 Tax=Aeromicrobium panaciterrae TaxID=363861 RepID=A0ABU1ULV8_9ACTN|nr:homocysteine S-methyltransferase family protein [Aeromicrobium panaciterrae]MDR7086178.1 S-methylmethionine-dependent homocysteine/selenocysteine methylase [Aeromicrobium panaciterrae]
MTGSDLLDGSSWVTDGGLETDLIFNHGIDLPEFASFPLVENADGVAVLERYYAGYAVIAAAAGAGLLVETPTWRANPDWGQVLGYNAEGLDRANRAAVDLARRAATTSGLDSTLVSGVVGPRGDGYLAGGEDPDEAAEYHSAQVRSFAAAGADLVHGMTITGPAEGIGIVRAARDSGLPVAISFTVETDGVLPDGSTLAAAVGRLEAEAPADWYGVNCAHPTHVLPALDGAAWQQRLRFFRPNASTMSHAELDEMEVLDAGDMSLLSSSASTLRGQVPTLGVLGGCCGTDSRHVAALWGV